MEADNYREELRLLEALLFASNTPLSIDDLKARVPDDKHDYLPALLKMLQLQYRDKGVNLNKIDDRWAFRTAPDLAYALHVEKEIEKKLSNAAIETLSIIAYHQPVTRAEIENIRGVATGRGTLDILMESEWIKMGRRRQVPGRPVTWITSNHFLDYFGLENLDDLPGVAELQASGLLDTRPAIDTIPETADMFGDDE